MARPHSKAGKYDATLYNNVQAFLLANMDMILYHVGNFFVDAGAMSAITLRNRPGMIKIMPASDGAIGAKRLHTLRFKLPIIHDSLCFLPTRMQSPGDFVPKTTKQRYAAGPLTGRHDIRTGPRAVLCSGRRYQGKQQAKPNDAAHNDGRNQIVTLFAQRLECQQLGRRGSLRLGFQVPLLAWAKVTWQQKRQTVGIF